MTVLCRRKAEGVEIFGGTKFEVVASYGTSGISQTPSEHFYDFQISRRK